MMLPWAHPDQHPGLDHLAAAVLRVDEFDPSFGGDHDHVEVHPMLGCLLPGREDQVGDGQGWLFDQLLEQVDVLVSGDVAHGFLLDVLRRLDGGVALALATGRLGGVHTVVLTIQAVYMPSICHRDHTDHISRVGHDEAPMLQ